MKIVEVHKWSPLYDAVAPGDELVSINGRAINDAIDLQFYSAADNLEVAINSNGATETYRFDDWNCGDLGLRLEDARIRVCNNKCIFCFVHQQPKGMRRSLYVRDDDFRFSFTHGNYISLSRMDDADYERITEQRLSPLYISVHATDDRLRRCIFQNERLEPIIPRLKHLTAHGIIVHTQTVICPGVNDGEHLDKTIEDLAALYPGVSTLAVVPVGLTRYRERLPQLRPYTRHEASEIIKVVAGYQERFLKEKGSRFVWPADEFYLQAGKELPALSHYEDMEQFENGVGMVRQFIVDFNRRKRYLPKRSKRKLRLGIVTGRSAESFIRRDIMPFISRIKNLDCELLVVDNKFWGETVTVTGLLTGGDIAAVVSKSKADAIMLPPNCLNNDGVFLDDMKITEFEITAARPVIRGSYLFAETVQESLQSEGGVS